MFYLSLLLALLPQVTSAPVQEATPPTSAPTYDQGPLRVELIAMREVRIRATDPVMASRMESDLRMQFRLQGEPLMKLARFGNLILTELVDDTGATLIDDKTYTEADKTMTRPVNFPKDRLRDNGLPLTTRSKPTARGALKLRQIRGTVHLVLAEKTEKLTILNPLQYVGKVLPDPRLQELGIEVEVAPITEVENPPPAERSIILCYKTKGENVQGASFVDGTMKPIAAREMPVNKTSGARCQLYYFDNAAAFNDEMQLVLEVHPQIEDIQLPIDLKDVDLP